MAIHSTSCGHCAFFDEHHLNGGVSAKEEGLCRFNPPVSQPQPEAHGLWPVVTGKDWCGHFKPQQAGGMQAAE